MASCICCSKLRTAGLPVSDTSEEGEGLVDDDDDVTSFSACEAAELRAKQIALEEKIAEQDRRYEEYVNETNREQEAWRQQLMREAAEERFLLQKLVQDRLDQMAAGASSSGHAPPAPRMETGSGSGGQDDAYRPQMPFAYQPTPFYQQGFENPPPQFVGQGFANPPPQFPQQGFANPPPQFPQQNPQQGFENPPGSPFFEGMDQERRFYNDEENEFHDLLRADDTGRNVANLTGTTRRSTRRGRRPPQ